MFGISGEHLLILGIVLLIFGPRRLPELGNTLGKAIKNFKDSLSGIEEAQFRRVQEQQKNDPHAEAPKADAAPTAAGHSETAHTTADHATAHDDVKPDPKSGTSA